MNNFVVVVDTQYDFMMPDGILYVNGAEELIVPINQYLANLSYEDTDGILFTFDTHVKKDYEGSPESELFPLHCELGTKGHRNVINPYIVGGIAFYEVYKPVFNMWAEEASDEHVYKYGGIPTWKTIEEFFRTNLNGVDTIDILGVALNFCVKQAVDGFVERGFKVRLHSKLTRGIDTGKPGDLDANILFAEEIEAGKVIIVD